MFVILGIPVGVFGCVVLFGCLSSFLVLGFDVWSLCLVCIYTRVLLVVVRTCCVDFLNLGC